ncbi:hypothetical protein ANCDUO_00489 [Ancylostoma duodenale]|uniref:DDE Tnp4 domain-containing protein n=1 Tax=Ancylostoma duodenale TaxID=51022 RepID=A0A0C2HBY4_9BILA|nr:hypothetical protein ANCDUO_00489 [Ancylostoma duodenale]
MEELSSMAFNTVCDLEDILWALETLQEMVEIVEDERTSRLYVREEHVPFLDSRFRNFDSYLAIQNPEEFAHFNRSRLFVGHDYTFATLAKELNIGKQTVADIVFEVTEAINSCTFTAFDVGAQGRAGDARVFRNPSIHTFFEEHDHLFPETTNLGDVGPVQYHVLVDGGFAQGHRYIRLFPELLATTASKRRFNRKHGGARRMIESSFGILCKRFSILQRDLQVEPEKASKLVTSMLVLHNLLAQRQDLLEHIQRYEPSRNGPLPERFAPVQRVPVGGGSDLAKLARDRLVTHYDNLYRPL